MLLVAFAATPSVAQFTHRYPKVAGYRHHIYLEGYELPVLNAGPSEPAISPDGNQVAFAARGWLWIMELESREARRVTAGAQLDSTPSWSPDGRTIAFVRDTGSDTAIWFLELATGETRVAVDTPALELDPSFESSGTLLFSSAASGDLDVWRFSPDTGGRRRLTTLEGLELVPRGLPDGRFVYLAKSRGGNDRIVVASDSGETRDLWAGAIASQLRHAASPDGNVVAAALPEEDRWRLFLLDRDDGPPIHIARASRLPLMPTWSPDGRHVYYVEADREQLFRLWRISSGGGVSEDVSPLRWDWGAPVRRVTIETRWQGSPEPLPVRLNVVDDEGHALIPRGDGMPRFDAQNGRVFFYSGGSITLETTSSEIRLEATHGFEATPAVRTERLTEADARIELQLVRLADPNADGWYSGDHHWHLNYGGPYQLAPDDIVTALRAEAIDVGTPLVANLHTRLSDLEHWDFERLADGDPLIDFGQEVRSHFLGHLGLLGIDEPSWPFYWGPGYPVYALDRTNAEALASARQQQGVGIYVHPVFGPDPFGDASTLNVPLELIPDAVLGDLDALEIACLWSNELGTAALWYRLLGIGIPIAPSAGTDVMPDLFRTLAIGATRVFVKVGDTLDLESYLGGLRAGRSFVTTGPLLDFEISGQAPGGVTSGGAASWRLRTTTPVPVGRIEVLVNGHAVWTGPGLGAGGRREDRGTLELPAGGWVAARAVGESASWPSMNLGVFAHTAPVWIDRIGSTEASVARAAARDLLAQLEAGLRRIEAQDAPMPRLEERFAQARLRLQALAR